MFRPNCRAIFRLIFEEVECIVEDAFNLRDLVLQDWKHYQSYTPPVQRSPWRWPYNWAEICSWNYSL